MFPLTWLLTDVAVAQAVCLAQQLDIVLFVNTTCL